LLSPAILLQLPLTQRSYSLNPPSPNPCSLVSKRPLATAHPVVEMRSFVWRTAMLFSRGFFGESQRVQSLLLGVGAFMLAFDYIRYVRAAAAAAIAAAALAREWPPGRIGLAGSRAPNPALMKCWPLSSPHPPHLAHADSRRC
jgi:hypothetical protein